MAMMERATMPELGAEQTVISRLRSLVRLRARDTGASAEKLTPDDARSTAARERRMNAELFDNLRVDDVMVPRADIIAVEVETTLGEVATRFAESNHSRLPVYRDSLDEPVGMVHIKDVLARLVPNGVASDVVARSTILPEVVRPVLYVPPSMQVADLLLKMQTRRIHMAVVVDEFGGTDGLVTLEDLIEQIVGDIEDEHDDEDAPSVVERSPQCWEVDARTPICDLEAVTQARLDIDDLSEEVDTVGGLVFTLAGRVPERGEVIRHPLGFEFEVIDADPRRIKRLVVRVQAIGGEATDDEDAPRTE